MKKLARIHLIVPVCLALCVVMTACSKAKSTGNDNTKTPDVPVPAFDDFGKKAEVEDAADKDGNKEVEKEAVGEEVTLGEVSGNVYSNDYFGFECTFPQDWDTVSTMEDSLAITKSFNKINSAEEIDLDKLADLLMFFAMTEGENTTSFMDIHALKIGSVTAFYSKITTVDELMKNTIGFKNDLGEDIELNDIKTVKIDSKEFKCWEQSLPSNVEQIYVYACEANGYIIVFTGSTGYDERTDDIESFINSITFK